MLPARCTLFLTTNSLVFFFDSLCHERTISAEAWCHELRTRMQWQAETKHCIIYWLASVYRDAPVWHQTQHDPSLGLAVDGFNWKRMLMVSLEVTASQSQCRYPSPASWHKHSSFSYFLILQLYSWNRSAAPRTVRVHAVRSPGQCLDNTSTNDTCRVEWSSCFPMPLGPTCRSSTRIPCPGPV